MNEPDRLKEEIRLLKVEIGFTQEPMRLEELQKNLILTYEYYVFLLNTENKKAAA